MKRLLAIIISAAILTATGCTSVTADSTSDAATSAAALSTAQSGYNKYFNTDKVIDIKINLSDEDYADMLANAKDEEYKSADVIVDGTSVKNVGFRTKGNLTLNSVDSSDSDRYSFRIKLDKYVEGQSLDGLDEFVINNMYSDASYMREYLSYEALRYIGVDTPQCVFANIYINDELKGLYLCIEAIDNSYIDRVFSNTEGNLYKAEMGSSLVYEADGNYDSLELKMGNDKEKTGLKNMITALNSIENGEKGSIEDVLDVDSALKYIAFNYVFSNYDSYLGHNQQNYYLYESNGKVSVIPWDYNMSFGGMGGGSEGGSLESPVSTQDTDNFPLVTKLLSIDEYRDKYYSYVKELMEYCSTLENRIAEVKTLISDDVKADPTKFCTMEDFEKATTYSDTQENENKSISEKMQSNTRTDAQPPQGKMMPPTDENGNAQTPPKNPQDGTIHPYGDDMQAPQQLPQDTNNTNQTDNKDANNFEAKENRGRIGGGHGMMQNNTSSIVNFVRNRIESINTELKNI